MGKPRDIIQRKTLARVDDANRRSRIAAARENIYEKNYAVHSAVVENLLREDSLVPTAVCITSPLVSSPWQYSSSILERVFGETGAIWLLLVPDACRGLDARV